MSRNETKIVSKNSGYIHALNLYWNEQYNESLNYLTQFIQENHDHSDNIKLYRLWMEILATSHDHMSLRVLDEHLFKISQDETHNYLNLFSLRGLIQLELDEIEHAQLTFQALCNIGKRNPYKDEFMWRLQKRQSKINPSSRLLQSDDYFTLRVLFVDASQQSRNKKVESIMEQMKSKFPQEPFVTELNCLQLLKAQDYKKAEKKLQGLIKKFPQNGKYEFLLSILENRVGNIRQSIDLATHSHKNMTQEIPEWSYLMGINYYHLFQHAPNIEHKNQAQKWLAKSAKELMAAGQNTFPADYFRDQLMNNTGDRRKTQDRQQAVWTVEVSERTFNSVVHQRNKNVVNMPLGEWVRQGDICIVVAKAQNGNSKSENKYKTWRIGAAYSIEYNCDWNPYSGNNAVLKLVTKPQYTPIVKVSLHDIQSKKKNERELPLYHLNDQAIEQITKSLATGPLGDKQDMDEWNHVVKELRQTS